MKRTTLVVVLAALLLGICGCGDQDQPLAPAPGPDGSADKTPPAVSGPRVVRSEVGYWTYLYDAPRDLFFIVGIDPIYALESDDWTIDVVEVQEVTNPQEQDIVNWHIHGDDLLVSVWRGNVVYWEDFFDRELIASGTCDMTATDNDYYAWLNDSARVNSFGWEAHGVLTTPDGEAVHMNVVSRTVWPGGDSTESRWVVGDIHLSAPH